MTEEGINDFVNGRVPLVPNPDGSFRTEPISEKNCCGCCGQTEEEISTVFKSREKIIYDSIRGSFGRHVGEGVVVDAETFGAKNSCFMYLIDTGEHYRWYHHCELKPFTEI